MLALNKNDNQGVRYELLPCLLALGRLEDAAGLILQFESDCEHCLVFAWGRVLERHLAGDVAGTKAALAAAQLKPRLPQPCAARTVITGMPSD